MTTISNEYLLSLRTYWKDVNFSCSGDEITFMGDTQAPTHEEVIARIPDAIANKNLGELKSRRNYLLSNCDWTVGQDSPLSDAKKEEWKVYRQSLRDITETYSTLEEVVWPTEPSA